MIHLRSVLGLGLLVSVAAVAQEGPRTNFTFNGGDFIYVRTEFGAGRVVKGSPYSAQAVTQHSQTLADGNRIQRTINSSIARDSEGRTRQEQAAVAIGALAGSSDAQKSIVIHDPVAGTTAMLDANNHQAHVNREPRTFTFSRTETPPAGTPAPHMRRQDDPNVKTEDLGTQVMEGLSVQGKRVTHTIPAGQMGNERPIETVTETWYSQDLQAVVMSKTIDPRNGESTYKLTNISRAEPDPALFQVPSDYTVTSDSRGPGPNGTHMVRRPAAKQ
ncbi:MAG TPA: hypothetical protein VEU96_23765 [Bryobacteraceae bacterium]|nr:hypothetical protein [Bryobacteraceae bacterium]